jgi:UDP-N-acetylglucosamine/UDP-N-acetylgalactosamine diphosphorylase
MDAELYPLLARFGQLHLLQFWPSLSAAQRAALRAEILSIDFEALRRGVAQGTSHRLASLEKARRALPPEVTVGGRRRGGSSPPAPRAEAALRRGEVAVMVFAGGEGSRLGFAHPKGMFPIGPVSGASLLQVLLEKTLATGRRYGAPLPLYLMTSRATHAATCAFLETHDFFGYDRNLVVLVCQGSLPAVDARSGRLLLAAPDRLALCPDGHGGMVQALARSGALDDLRQRGIRWLFTMQVDNPLVRVCDEALLEAHLAQEAEMSVQVVRKVQPRERLGNVVLLDGRTCILEYSELDPLPDAVVERRDSAGRSVFWAGNTGVHVFDVSFLQRVAGEHELPLHAAHKIVPYFDAGGHYVRPQHPNAWKLERFVFDLLPLARHTAVVQADRRQTFAPLKNAPGAAADTPQHVQQRMLAVYRRWLRRAGVALGPRARVEISPLWALDLHDVQHRADLPRRLAGNVYLSGSPAQVPAVHG